MTPTLDTLRRTHDALARALNWPPRYHFDRAAPVISSRWLEWYAGNVAAAIAHGAEERAPEELAACRKVLAEAGYEEVRG